MDLFYGKARCGSCHAGPFQTDHEFHAIAMPQIGPGKNDGRHADYWSASGHEAFLDQALTWRELGFNLAAADAGYDRWESLPPWAIATLDEDPGRRNALHLFAASRPDWIEIRDDLPAFDTVPDLRGRVLEVGPDGLRVQPDGAAPPQQLRVAGPVPANRPQPVRVGERIHASLPHDEDRFRFRVEPDDG